MYIYTQYCDNTCICCDSCFFLLQLANASRDDGYGTDLKYGR